MTRSASLLFLAMVSAAAAVPFAVVAERVPSLAGPIILLAVLLFGLLLVVVGGRMLVGRRKAEFRLQFGLGTMLFALVPIAVFFAWPGRWIFTYAMRQNALARIRQRGGTVQVVEGSYAVKLGTAEFSGLRYLTDAGALDLAGTTVTDADLAQLGSFDYLVFLDLSQTTITDAGLTHLQNLSNLRILALQNTSVTDQGLAHLQGLKNLENLVLDETQVGDAGLQSLQRCTKLRVLTLWGTQVSDAGLVHLTGLPSLNTVALPESISDSAIRELKTSCPTLNVFK